LKSERSNTSLRGRLIFLGTMELSVFLTGIFLIVFFVFSIKEKAGSIEVVCIGGDFIDLR
jgi:hypothetical protein